MFMIGKVVALLFAFLTRVPLADESADEALLESKVRPLLVERCYECHSGEMA
jgi:hypothetical protein